MIIEKIETEIPGCFELKLKTFEDNRGGFTKLFHSDVFTSLGLDSDFKEEYFSTSKKGVLRGLHFQTPPHEHVKCIICIKGAIWDVVVDLRKDSPTYGKHTSFELNGKEPTLVYIPVGLAHGFYTLEDNTIFLNKTTSVFNTESDAGIKWDSCGISWPNPDPILSDKDINMISLDNFDSPF